MPRIFHYTSIESLALILKTRKLRFTRLDRVDDIREAQTHAGIEFGKYFFVSCWTLQAVESIPQWHMYSSDMKGIRLELPEYPFHDRPCRPKDGWTGIRSMGGELYSPIPFEEMFGPSYFIAPMFLDRKQFAGEVDYVEDANRVYAESVKREDKNGAFNLRISNFGKLSRVKTDDWAFQKEFRFSLFALPAPPTPTDGPANPIYVEQLLDHMTNSLANRVAPKIEYIDVELDPNVFDELIVRTGPLCTPGGRVCVEALLNSYAPGARLETSALEGAIRTKGA